MPSCKANTYVYGNIWIREMRFRKGDVKNPHVHKFDHITVVTSGKVEVYLGNDLLVTLVAGGKVKVPAGQAHKIIALEDSSAMCMQAFRDKDLEEVVLTDFNEPNWVEPELTTSGKL